MGCDQPRRDRPVRILSKRILADDRAKLPRYTIELTRRDGRPEKQVRQVYDRGDGAMPRPPQAPPSRRR